LVFIPVAAPAQSIGVFSNASATSCNVIWDTSQGIFAEIYLHVLLGPLRNFTAAEFRAWGCHRPPFRPQPIVSSARP
jgi:hypothetical protein